MLVKDLIQNCVDKIVIYKEVSDTDYSDLFIGEKKDIPKRLLGLEVRVFGAKSQGVIEIEIVNQ